MGETAAPPSGFAGFRLGDAHYAELVPLEIFAGRFRLVRCSAETAALLAVQAGLLGLILPPGAYPGLPEMPELPFRFPAPDAPGDCGFGGDGVFEAVVPHHAYLAEFEGAAGAFSYIEEEQVSVGWGAGGVIPPGFTGGEAAHISGAISTAAVRQTTITIQLVLSLRSARVCVC